MGVPNRGEWRSPSPIIPFGEKFGGPCEGRTYGPLIKSEGGDGQPSSLLHQVFDSS
jgi:hypothetical protein